MSDSALKMQFQQALTEVVATATEVVGTLREDNLGNRYRYVKNVDATALIAGQPVCWDSAANAGSRAAYLGDVTLAVDAELMNAAGICVTAIAISGGKCYGWVMVDGYFTDASVRVSATGAIQEGSELIMENTGLNLVYQGAAGTAAIYTNCFRALQILATDGTGTATSSIDVLVKCM